MKGSSIFCRPPTIHDTCLRWPLEVKKKPFFYNNLKAIEKHWKNRIGRFKRNDLVNLPSKYVLAMFPYPSGRLHMGHLRVYSISDVCSRYYALNGYNVLHPIGWDAFGLPAENAAFQHGVDPMRWTYDNIKVMRDQLLRTGVDFDWDQEICTCNSDYFKWTQWLFLKLYEKQLVRQTVAEVNWDPVDNTVLAAEQVDERGRSWRSGATVEKRKHRHWMVETPKYAKRLADGLEAIKFDWGEVAGIQSNWIGKCDVYRFILPVTNSKHGEMMDLRLKDPVKLASAQFLLITPDHSLADNSRRSTNEAYIIEETVFNFLNGIEMPIIVVPTVDVAGGGQFFMNARLGDPVCSEFDSNLARKFCVCLRKKLLECQFDVAEVQRIAEEKNYGGYLTSRTLQDWIVSRQRAWGTPIPMVIDESGSGDPQPFAADQLPLLSDQRGRSIEFNSFPSGRGRIETDTLDTFFDSSWYFLRYLDPQNATEFVNADAARFWMPVDIYVGGVEHADLHLFYARFISHFLYDLGVLREHEPFRRLIPQGIVKGRTFFVAGQTDAYVPADDVEPRGAEDAVKSNENRPSLSFVRKSTGEPVEQIYEKMSKSKANGVDPLVVIEEDGIDLARMQLLIAAAPRQPLNWGQSRKADMRGLHRFINRCASSVDTYVLGRSNAELYENCKVDASVEESYSELRNKSVRIVSNAIETTNSHNAAIQQMSIFASDLKKADVQQASVSREFEKCIHSLVIMLQVFAPHLAAELWSALAGVPKLVPKLWLKDESVSAQKWPVTDADSFIDFIVWANGYTVRCEERRNLVEPLDAASIYQMARGIHHAQFFRALDSHQLAVRSMEVKRRPGLHVTVYLKVADDANDSGIQRVLCEVRSAKLKALKAEQSPRKAVKETAAA